MNATTVSYASKDEILAAFKRGELDAAGVAAATAALKAAAPVNGKPKTYASQMEVLEALRTGAIDASEASKELAKFAAPVQRGNVYCKVSQKGALSLYGINRMPVTLYVEQWERVAENMPMVMDFIKANEGKTHQIDEKDDKFKPTGRKLNVKLERKAR